MFVVVEIVIRSVWSLYLSSSGTQSDNWSVCVHCNYLNSSPLSLPCYWLPPPARGQRPVTDPVSDWQSVSPRKPQPVSHVCCACAGNNWDNIISISIAQSPSRLTPGQWENIFITNWLKHFLNITNRWESLGGSCVQTAWLALINSTYFAFHCSRLIIPLIVFQAWYSLSPSRPPILTACDSWNI